MCAIRAALLPLANVYGNNVSHISDFLWMGFSVKSKTKIKVAWINARQTVLLVRTSYIAYMKRTKWRAKHINKYVVLQSHNIN